jgi:hypothetical protein
MLRFIEVRGWWVRTENISTKGPWNRRSLRSAAPDFL